MRQFAVFLLMAATLLAAPHARAERAIVAAADFKLDDHAGKVVMLDFWASWCKPCKMSMPWLSYMQRVYGKQGLQVVAVSVDKDETAMRERLGDLDPGIVIVFDPQGKLAAEYKLEGMPTTFLIDRAGKAAGCHIGFLEKNAGARETEVKALLAGQATKEAK